MSIASELTALHGDITAARSAITAKGGTVTPNGGSSQLATDIATIPSGGGVGITREVTAQGVYQIPQSNFTFSTPESALDLGDKALKGAFWYPDEIGTSTLVGADLSSLTQISGASALSSAFRQCLNFTTCNLSNVTKITGHLALSYAFAASGITSLSVDKLVKIGDDTTTSNDNYGQFSWAFQYVTTLLQLSFPLLENIYASGNNVNGGTFAKISR